MHLVEVGTALRMPGVLYEGGASYVLAEHTDGSAVAAASWRSPASRASWGVCHLTTSHSRLVDECSFSVASGTLTSVDVLDPATAPGWQRTYDDGVRVTIAVSPKGAAIPVPFPIGH